MRFYFLYSIVFFFKVQRGTWSGEGEEGTLAAVCALHAWALYAGSGPSHHLHMLLRG